MKILHSVFYNILSAAAIIQNFLFGNTFESWGHKILNSFIGFFAISIFICSYKVFNLNGLLASSFSLIPFVILIIFYRNDNEQTFELSLQKFREGHKLTKIGYCGIIILFFLIIPIIIISYLIYS